MNRTFIAPPESSLTTKGNTVVAIGVRRGSVGVDNGALAAPKGVHSTNFAQTAFWEVRAKNRDKGLGGTRIFHECLQVPHDPLRPLPVHHVSSIRVYHQPSIGDRRCTPLLFLTL
jgi:hypothetical protein